MTCELPTVGQLHSLSEELICLVTPEIQPIHAIILAICIHNHSLRETDRNQTEHNFCIKSCAGVRIGVRIELRQLELQSESQKSAGVGIGVGIEPRQSESKRSAGFGVRIVEAESNPGLVSTTQLLLPLMWRTSVVNSEMYAKCLCCREGP